MSRKKIGLGCAGFLHSGTGYIEIAVLFFVPISIMTFCTVERPFYC